MRLTRSGKVLGGFIVALGITAIVVHWWMYADVVNRRPEVVEDLPPYGDELRSLTPYGDSGAAKEGPSYKGPGWYQQRSRDGRRAAVTTSWGYCGVFLGFLSDRPYIHTIKVWDARSGQLVPVMSVMEADPASGASHEYTWSKDSKALLIHGSGRLQEDYDDVIALCLVYLPEKDELFRLKKCRSLS